MKGATCPKCKNEVVGYAQAFRDTEPYKAQTCRHCGTELKRSPLLWLLLASMVVPIVVYAFFLMPLMSEWTPTYKLFSGFLFFAILFLVANFIGWRYIPWRLVRR